MLTDIRISSLSRFVDAPYDQSAVCLFHDVTIYMSCEYCPWVEITATVMIGLVGLSFVFKQAHNTHEEENTIVVRAMHVGIFCLRKKWKTRRVFTGTTQAVPVDAQKSRICFSSVGKLAYSDEC